MRRRRHATHHFFVTRRRDFVPENSGAVLECRGICLPSQNPSGQYHAHYFESAELSSRCPRASRSVADLDERLDLFCANCLIWACAASTPAIRLLLILNLNTNKNGGEIIMISRVKMESTARDEVQIGHLSFSAGQRPDPSGLILASKTDGIAANFGDGPNGAP